MKLTDKLKGKTLVWTDVHDKVERAGILELVDGDWVYVTGVVANDVRLEESRRNKLIHISQVVNGFEVEETLDEFN